MLRSNITENIEQIAEDDSVGMFSCFCCNDDDIRYSTFKQVKNHAAQHTKNDSVKHVRVRGSPILTCSICNAVFDSPKMILRHKKAADHWKNKDSSPLRFAWRIKTASKKKEEEEKEEKNENNNNNNPSEILSGPQPTDKLSLTSEPKTQYQKIYGPASYMPVDLEEDEEYEGYNSQYDFTMDEVRNSSLYTVDRPSWIFPTGLYQHDEVRPATEQEPARGALLKDLVVPRALPAENSTAKKEVQTQKKKRTVNQVDGGVQQQQQQPKKKRALEASSTNTNASVALSTEEEFIGETPLSVAFKKMCLSSEQTRARWTKFLLSQDLEYVGDIRCLARRHYERLVQGSDVSGLLHSLLDRLYGVADDKF